MRKAFDIVNMYTLTYQPHQTNIPHTNIKFIVNYTKGRTAYTTISRCVSGRMSDRFTIIGGRAGRQQQHDDNEFQKTQPARSWDAAEICTHCVYTTPTPEMGPDSVLWARRPSLNAAWLALPLTKARDVESNRRHTQTNFLVRRSSWYLVIMV